MSIDQIFAAPAVLENILMRVPSHRLRHVKKVNRAFKNAIENTVSLQEKLFLSPGADLSTLMDTSARIWYYGDTSETLHATGHHANLASSTRPKLNQMLLRPMENDQAALKKDMIYCLPDHIYRHMYITQPPVNQMTMILKTVTSNWILNSGYGYVPGHNRGYFVPISCNTGVTLDVVIAHVRRKVRDLKEQGRKLRKDLQPVFDFGEDVRAQGEGWFDMPPSRQAGLWALGFGRGH